MSTGVVNLDSSSFDGAVGGEMDFPSTEEECEEPIGPTA